MRGMIRYTVLAAVIGVLFHSTVMAADKAIELRFAQITPAAHPYYSAISEPWAKEIEKRTGGKVKITCAKFDVAYVDFQVIEGKTNEQGHYDFEVELPSVKEKISNVVIVHGVNERDQEKLANGESPQNERHWR